ncbi:MAG: hypothetical protein ABIJ12_12020 [bacterium]
MRNIFKRLTVAAALTLLVAISCTDRGANNHDPIPPSSGGPVEGYDHQFNELYVQIANQPQKLYMSVYIPNQDLQQSPLPLVLLLPPQGGSEHYYYDHGLKQLADKLIAEGTIIPMAIACIKADRTFGGYFWAGNSGGGSGDYDQIMGSKVLENFVTKSQGLILADDPSKCGIGGVGTGAYGAFRAALINDHKFSSITVTDGPLDFDGADGNSGWISMFDDVLIEQGLVGYTHGPGELSWTDLFDSSFVNQLSRIIIGGSIAFSPHDTLCIARDFYFDYLGYYAPPTNIPIIDTLTEYPYTDTLFTQIRWQLADSTTLCKRIVKPEDWDFDFHLPFDSTGQPYAPIWNMWLRNNLETILSDSGNSRLNGVDIWIGTSPEQALSYREQTTAWINHLESQGFDPEVYEYSGYEGHPATSDQYIYELMEQMLIFHSRNFEAAMIPGKTVSTADAENESK